MAFLKSLKNDSMAILEIGCGYTPICKGFPKFSSYLGIEPGSAPYSTVTQMAEEDERVSFRHGYLSEWAPELGPSNFDAIVVTGVLHEVDDPESFLSSIGLLMKPGTRAYLNVPNSRSLHRLIGLASGHLQDLETLSSRGQDIEQREVYDLVKLENQIKAAIPRVEIESLGSFFLKPFTHRQMQFLIDNGELDEKGVEGLYQVSENLPGLGAELFITFSLAEHG